MDVQEIRKFKVELLDDIHEISFDPVPDIETPPSDSRGILRETRDDDAWQRRPEEIVGRRAGRRLDPAAAWKTRRLDSLKTWAVFWERLRRRPNSGLINAKP